MRGISLISGVLFLAFSIAAVTIVYQAGVPIISKIQASAAIDSMKSTLTDLDEIIQEVASEGKGSKRTVYMKMDVGEIEVNGTEEYIAWSLDTSAPVISPGTSQKFGNVVIGSNMETSVTTGNYSGTAAYVMENERLIVYINRTGSSSSFTTFNTSQLLLAIKQKDLGQWFNNTNMLQISVDDNANSMFGNGFTTAVETGSNLAYGEVKAYMNSTYNIAYYVHFILRSGADYLDIRMSTTEQAS